MSNKPLISIVIPSYNHGHLIARAIKSVLAQTYSNWEAIIVDNHSTDQTKEVTDALSIDVTGGEQDCDIRIWKDPISDDGYL